ncbi:MAG: TolB-like protein [Paraglaciecola sp.]|jgi:TolB-like protein
MKKRNLLSLSALCWLSFSCSIWSPDEQKEAPQLADDTASVYGQNRFSNHNMQDVYQKTEMGDVNHYVQGIMQDLIANMDTPDNSMDIGVTSFVYLDSNFDDTDLLGNQLSESFMHELHQFGLNVLDFKSSDYIRVTPNGDFNFSRDYEELKPDMPVQYIMGGTMVKHQDGVMVNARMVSLNSKKILSTAQGFIPASVVNALHRSQEKSGMSLKFKQGGKS